MLSIDSFLYCKIELNSSTEYQNGAIKAEVGQPLFFYITGSNKLLNDISIS